jgi:hypothetical protein
MHIARIHGSVSAVRWVILADYLSFKQYQNDEIGEPATYADHVQGKIRLRTAMHSRQCGAEVNAVVVILHGVVARCPSIVILVHCQAESVVSFRYRYEKNP